LKIKIFNVDTKKSEFKTWAEFIDQDVDELARNTSMTTEQVINVLSDGIDILSGGLLYSVKIEGVNT